MKARFEGWKRDLLLGLWLFSQRTESQLTGVLPVEVVQRIVRHLRYRQAECLTCGKLYEVDCITATIHHCNVPWFDPYAGGIASGYANPWDEWIRPHYNPFTGVIGPPPQVELRIDWTRWEPQNDEEANLEENIWDETVNGLQGNAAGAA